MMILGYIRNYILYIFYNMSETIIKNNDKKDKHNKKNKHKKDKHNINLINSLKENYLSWLVLFISAAILSYPNITNGIITAICCYFWYYIIHRIQHTFDLNITNIIHTYHHDHSRTFLSDLTEVILEINFLNSILPYLYIFNIPFINIWVILLYTFMYITIHNINYTILRVNDVHRAHHLNTNTNHGPDVCDIIFGSKSKLDREVENTDHYIPNIIIGFIFVYIIQCLHRSSEKWRYYLNCAGIGMLLISLLLYVVFSIYLWIFVSDDLKNEIREKKKKIKQFKKEKKANKANKAKNEKR